MYISGNYTDVNPRWTQGPPGTGVQHKQQGASLFQIQRARKMQVWIRSCDGVSYSGVNPFVMESISLTVSKA